MTITFTGDSFTSTQRVLTGCYSLDLSLVDRLGNAGFPLKSITEVYGNKGVGKSTFCFSLMGLIASQLDKNIVILDWEGQSKETIEGVLNEQKFEGNVNYILNKADESSEETVERLIESIWDEEQNIALVDSIGGYTPTAYLEGNIADSNMGIFARETGRMVNKAKHAVLQSGGVIFMTNHKHPTFGSRTQGSDTSGGVTKKFLSHVRLDLNRAYIGNSPVSFPDSWLVKGRVDDNRYGFSKREFYVFMMAGEGIHLGLTALWDCVMLGYATLSSKSIGEGNTLSMDGSSYGKIGRIIRDRKEFDFTPFHNRLRVEEYVEEPEEAEPILLVGKAAEKKMFERMNEGTPKKKRGKK